MDIPNHLSHKPIVKIEGYSQIDGRFNRRTDAEGLSIGKAQWNRDNGKDLSAKVWRYTGTKWSRQSEELPLHRVLDLASLICASISYTKNNALPIHDEFHVSLTRDKDLNDILKEGIKIENGGIEIENGNDGYLNKSLIRLSKYLKDLGY